MSYKILSRKEKHRELLKILNNHGFRITDGDGYWDMNEEEKEISDMFKEIEEIVQTYES